MKSKCTRSSISRTSFFTPCTRVVRFCYNVFRRPGFMPVINEYHGASSKQLLQKSVPVSMLRIFRAGTGTATLELWQLLVPATMLTIWFQKRSSVIYRQIQTNSVRLISHFVETVSGIRAVKSYRRQQANGERYTQLAEDHRQSSLRSIQLFGIYQPTLRWLSSFTIAAVLMVGGFRVLGGELQVGVLVALVLYARRFFQPIDEIANFYNTFQSAVAA